MKLVPHHVGCAVSDLEFGGKMYSDSLGLHKKTRSFDIASQGIRACFFELRDHFYLELVTPLTGKNTLANFLKVGFYHLCFLVEDLEAARDRLKAEQFHPLPVFSSEAFGGGRCQFFVSPQLHLIELAQMSTGDFEAFFAAHLSPI